jgi:vesicle coat complex subunit
MSCSVYSSIPSLRSHIPCASPLKIGLQRRSTGLLQVQLQTLTAVVKLYLNKPDSSQGIVQRILNTATKDCESPDVRDRAYIYWRLLSTDPGAAKVRFGAF